jgi:microsomal epoxide hydrolase
VGDPDENAEDLGMKTRPIILTVLLALTCLLAAGEVAAQVETRSRHFTTSDGVRLHYLEAGAGPTLVFVPGWTMPAEVWEPQIRHFAATHHVVALDPRGHGRSEKPAHGYYPSRRGQDIGELLEHLGGEPAVVVSWSLGVQETLVYVDEHGTDAVRALVLVDWDITDEEPEHFTSRYISLQVEREEWTREFIEVIFRNPPSDEYLETMTQAALSVPTNAAAIMIGNLVLMGPNDSSPVVDALDRPVLFVYSSLGWAVEAADEVRRAWPDSRVEVVDETSHALFVDQADAFNRLLEEFLATLSDG